MPALAQSALAKRASKHRLGPDQLGQLLQLLEGRCMVCLCCHAMVVDTAMRTAERWARGVLCRFCRERIADFEGSYGHGNPFFVACRCRRLMDEREWNPRIAAATAQYLNRTGPLEFLSTNRERFGALADDLRKNGPDPQAVWNGAPVASLPELPQQHRRTPSGYDHSLLPLSRPHCANGCRDHDEHVYVACFPEPVRLHDADRGGAELHYVGWTRQQPPVRRVTKHGAVCRESLVAIVPGTQADEQFLKAQGECPQCGKQLRE